MHLASGGVAPFVVILGALHSVDSFHATRRSLELKWYNVLPNFASVNSALRNRDNAVFLLCKPGVYSRPAAAPESLMDMQ